jgi:hypothetical protein
VVNVKTLIALKTNQIGLIEISEDFGNFRFTDSCFTFQQERSLQLQRQKDSRRQPSICDVKVVLESSLERFNGGDFQN